MSALAKKLLIKAGHRVLVLNAPDGYTAQLSPLPEGATLHTAPEGEYDVVQLFAINRAELERHASDALTALKQGGIFWIAYPKGSSKLQTDLSRDRGWDVIGATGREIVAQISIDEKWSGSRFKPSDTVMRSRKK